MDYEAIYDYCTKLQYQAITDAYSRLDAGDIEGFKNLMGLAAESLEMSRCCMVATEMEMVH